MTKSIKEQADEAFSKWVKLYHARPDGFCKCWYCGGLVFWKYADAAHFIKRGNMSLRYSEYNVHPAHRNCNQEDERSGDKQQYEKNLKKAYGKDIVKELELKGKSIEKKLAYEIKDIRDYYRRECIKIAKIKGIEL